MDNRWNRIAEMFDSAVDREPTERSSFVHQACSGDEQLRHQVEALLAEADRPARPLVIDRTVEEIAADLLADNDPVVIGTHLGAYRIESLLGVGGMGEVYRAKDTLLGRQVAIKILPPAFAADPDRLARFKREAQILASLNHPNIGAIYGLENLEGEDHSTPGLVLELVEGPTLAERLGGHPLPVDEAIAVARQIASALEAAHERGIVHRDLKPGNIKVRDDGTVKVLDFGLAKAMDTSVDGAAQGVDAGPSDSPTITTPAMTAGGIILGTAAYMSPEQARGKPADKRSDIWAFGAVVYEMLTGMRPFAGEGVSDVLASVLAREPDWTRLPATLSPTVNTFIRRCLHKNPKQRIADVQDMRLALDGAFETKAPGVAAGPVGWRRIATLAATAVIGATVAAAVVWMFMRPADRVPPRLSRLHAITPSNAAALTISAPRGIDARDVAITPDGSRLIYVGNNGTQLFVRALDALEPVSVFTGSPRGPFVSPDGEWIGFVDGGNALKKVAMSGGTAVTVTTIDGPTPRGATWGPDDTIIFATTNPSTGLQQVPASPGGKPIVLTQPDRAQGEADHAWPEALPGGRAVLFTVLAMTGGLEAAQVVVLDLRTGARTVLVRGGSHAHYLPSGHLVYATPGTLRAVPFDPMRLETRGTSVAVVRDVVTTPNGAVDAVVADDGTLAYVPGGPVAQATRTLVWVDRQGRETPIQAPPRAYVFPRLSPDGARVVAFMADRELDLWLLDLARPTLTPVTSSPGVDSYPLWTPDGHKLIFSSQRAGVLNLFSQAADGSGQVEQLTESPNAQAASAISPDGHALIFTETSPTTGEDVMQIALDGTRRVTPLVQSRFAERNGIVSPDGRWLAYETNESGQFEIFVAPFPDVNAARSPVSTAGGTRPLWASSRELVYVSLTGALMRVGVVPGPSWSATPPAVLVREGYATSTGNPGRWYDFDPRRQRFLMVKEGGGEGTAAPASIVVVQNWVEELKRLAPAK